MARFLSLTVLVKVKSSKVKATVLHFQKSSVTKCAAYNLYVIFKLQIVSDVEVTHLLFFCSKSAIVELEMHTSGDLQLVARPAVTIVIVSSIQNGGLVKRVPKRAEKTTNRLF